MSLTLTAVGAWAGPPSRQRTRATSSADYWKVPKWVSSGVSGGSGGTTVSLKGLNWARLAENRRELLQTIYWTLNSTNTKHVRSYLPMLKMVILQQRMLRALGYRQHGIMRVGPSGDAGMQSTVDAHAHFNSFRKRYLARSLTRAQYADQLLMVLKSKDPLLLLQTEAMLLGNLPLKNRFDRVSERTRLLIRLQDASTHKARQRRAWVESFFKALRGSIPYSIYVSGNMRSGTVFTNGRAAVARMNLTDLHVGALLKSALGSKRFKAKKARTRVTEVSGASLLNLHREVVERAKKSGKYHVVIEVVQNIEEADVASLGIRDADEGLRYNMGMTVIVYLPALGVQKRFFFHMAHREPRFGHTKKIFARSMTQSSWTQNQLTLAKKVAAFFKEVL